MYHSWSRNAGISLQNLRFWGKRRHFLEIWPEILESKIRQLLFFALVSFLLYPKKSPISWSINNELRQEIFDFLGKRWIDWPIFGQI